MNLKVNMKTIALRLIILATAIGLSVPALVIASKQGSKNSKESFFEQRYRGWLWFEEKERSVISSEQNEKPQKLTPELMQQAKRANEQFAKELAMLKHLVIHYPDNLEYIRLYKQKEKKMMERAQKLAVNWHMVNFLHPEIVDELKNPQNMYGRDVFEIIKERNEQIALTNLAGKVELFVFRQGNCSYCQLLEKHLHRFKSKYGFTVEAVSPDNSKSDYFKTHSSAKLIKALNLKVMPTVIAVVNDSRQRFELARGAVSVADLESKALLLFKYLQKQEKSKNEQIRGEKKTAEERQERYQKHAMISQKQKYIGLGKEEAERGKQESSGL